MIWGVVEPTDECWEAIKKNGTIERKIVYFIKISRNGDDIYKHYTECSPRGKKHMVKSGEKCSLVGWSL